MQKSNTKIKPIIYPQKFKVSSIRKRYYVFYIKKNADKITILRIDAVALDFDGVVDPTAKEYYEALMSILKRYKPKISIIKWSKRFNGKCILYILNIVMRELKIKEVNTHTSRTTDGNLSRKNQRQSNPISDWHIRFY